MHNITLHPIDLIHPNPTDRDALRNLFNLWHHDLAAMDPSEFPNMSDNGYYEYTATDVYFEEQCHGKIIAYLIRSNGVLAGFCVISLPPFIVRPDCDWCIQEFFITANFRGKGVASEACKTIFKKHPGRCGFDIFRENKGAKVFWSKLINSVGTDVIVENADDANDVVYTFTI